MLRKIPLAVALAAVLCVPVPAFAASFIETVFGHVQVDSRSHSPAQKRQTSRHLGNHDRGPRHAAGTVLASWYGGAKGEHLSSRTASGEAFRPGALTCAHRSLPFGTRLRVGFRGRSVVVRVTDRGPSARTGRSLDLSRGAAAVLGLTRVGVGRVSIERI